MSPSQMNCPHIGEGWCLECVAKMQAELDAARKAMQLARYAIGNPYDIESQDAARLLLDPAIAAGGKAVPEGGGDES